MSNSGIDKEALLAVSRQIVESLEKGEDAELDNLIDEVVSIRENKLFQEIGKLTRELHDSIHNFQLDDVRIADLAETEIPDARERLEYVITMTEQSADKTLTAIEESQPAVDTLGEKLQDISNRWQQFIKKELSAEEFRNLVSDVTDFHTESSATVETLKSNLNTVLMAQDFQDLTGQIIRKVINLVGEVESNLVDLIRLQGDAGKPRDENAEEVKAGRDALEGPQIPGSDSADVMNSQDDVDDLLASLGF